MTRLSYPSLVVVLCSLSAAAAEQDQKAEAKEAARAACLEAADQNYGEAIADGRAHRKKIGRSRGYAFNVKVGNDKKRVNCFVDSKGEVTFFSGSL